MLIFIRYVLISDLDSESEEIWLASEGTSSPSTDVNESEETLLASEGTSSSSADVIPNEEPSFSDMLACMYSFNVMYFSVPLFRRVDK